MQLKQVIKHTDADFEEQHAQMNLRFWDMFKLIPLMKLMQMILTGLAILRVYFKYNTRANIPKIVLTEQVEWFGHFRGEWFRLISIDQHQEYGFVIAHAERWENVT